jgi:two-component system sensor kinase FixL
MQRNRQQLAHLSRVSTVGQLSTTLAHELNQPLSSILSNAEAALRILAQESIDLDEVRAIVADIVREDLRAVEMIRRLRDMLRPRQSQVQQLDLAQLAREVLALVRGELIAKHVKAIIRLPQTLPLVSGDRVQIQQVLLNLLLNAAEAMEGIDAHERVIEVTADSEAGAVHLQVIDRGSGIPEGRLHQVFEAFFTTKSGGMGLGLAISRSIVSAHGGRLWASNNAGPGASFHLTLPSVGLKP